MSENLLNFTKKNVVTSDNALFIILNFASSIIIFGRSILFLKYLGNVDLGVILIIQTLISFIGLAQIGLFNGGTRLFSLDSEKANHSKINTVNTTYTIVITIFLVIIGIITEKHITLSPIILIFAIIAGGATMLKTWYTNLLITRRKVKEVNILIIISTSISSMIAVSVLKIGITGALISIFSLPILFILFFYIRNNIYVPRKLNIDRLTIKRELTFGFVPYLGGFVMLLNTQVDRFFVAGILDIESLGELYLASIFIRFFNLFPTSLNSLYMPKVINEYSKKNISIVQSLIKKFFIALVIYSLIAVTGTIFFAKPILLSIFPDKLSQLTYVFIILPGIVIQMLSKPINLTLHSSLNLKAVLYSNVVAFCIYLIMLLGLRYTDNFTLISVSVTKSLQGVALAITTLLFYFTTRKKILNYHYINLNKYE